MALSSNSNAGSTETKVGAGALSNFKTENKSNGNFSGGDINFDTSKLSINNPFDTKESQQPTFNTDDVFKPTVSGNLDIDLPKTNNNSSSNNTTYSNNSNEPTMTVDEVYGKSNNQPVVEKQGDYSTSSNEKSNVETSTFGKQDEISVTPTSVTENKGMVGNAAIQSVEGLDFQQKDKASVDVLDSKKKRDEVEAEDRADSMRNKLKAGVNNAKQEEGGEDFRIGDRDEDLAATQKEVDRLANEKAKYEKEQESNARRLKSIYAEAEKYRQALEQEDADFQTKKANIEQLDAIGKNIWAIGKLLDTMPVGIDEPTMVKSAQRSLDNLTSRLGVDSVDLPTNNIQEASKVFQSWQKSFIQEHFDGLKDFSPNKITAYKAGIEKEYLQRLMQYTNELDNLVGEGRDLENRQKDLSALIKATGNKYAEAKVAYDKLVNESYVVPEEAPVEAPVETETTPATTNTPVEEPKSNAEEAINLAKDAINNSADATPEQKAQAEEAITNLEDSRKELEDAAAKARSGNPADMAKYQEALEKYNKNLKKAQKIGNRFTQTDFNEKYTKAVMNAKDFNVKLSDGTEIGFSDFMSEEAEKSPQYAKAMYEAKATKLEKDGHPILAKIERKKAEWSQTVLGSKFTFLDNKVRNQFYQFTDTNMRATYATLNNVLNDKTGKYSDEDKAAASKEIEQAKALKTAAFALKASTGVDDDPSDGMFGTTDVTKLTDDQRTMASIKMFTQAVLGLGISPAANRAYQNYYYLNRGDGSVFENDIDNDGFTWVEEYGNNAAAGLVLAAGELGVGVVMMLNPASFTKGADLIVDAVTNASNALYGVRNSVEETQKMTQDILGYFKKAEQTNGLPEEAHEVITNAITQIENFELKSDEVGNLDNWLEGSGSNTATNEKFNQSLTYDEWLKLIEADPTMKEFAKSIAKKKDKDAQKGNADAGVNS